MYDPQTWVLGLAGGTPLNADRLNHMEQGIADAHSLIASLAASSHTHVSADITDATAANTADKIVKRDDVGFIAVSGITGLSTASGASQAVPKSQLDDAITSHGHAISGVTGLQTALDGKAASVHTHVAANITDLKAFIAGLLVEGTDIAISVDGVTGAITINSTGGSGGTIATLPAGSLIFVNQNDPGGTWPNRPTARTDLKVVWVRTVAGSSDPAIVTAPAVNGAYNKDLVVGA